ncbi:hypothetical protein CVT25_007052 [Psilocybe cyanescens]|uniref:Peptidase A1 domain-containing protein n=1 Tax=Psilocybe cyanescens TaxID=93625 RepID=A0A409WYB6_PSICY|nr:hypothetical protein CVT25_007052 [Psilocybe cyanescens]
MQQAWDVHRRIYLQQYINLTVRRLARMTRREECLDRRLSLEKRYNRIGVLKSAKNGAKVAGTNKSKNGKLAGKKHRKHSGKGSGNNSTSVQSSSNPQATAANGVTLANPPTANNSLGLDIEANDAGYLATLQMGTLPQDFLILMDSGSADLWVGAENCQADTGGDCGTLNFLGPKGSSSFVGTGKPFSITYGSGQVSGDNMTDNLVIANLALPAHTFGAATTEIPFDGLTGLANSINFEQKTLTPVESLAAAAAASLISDAIVSYKISLTADNINDGEVIFGGLYTAKFDSKTLVTLPNVNKCGLWEVDLTAMRFTYFLKLLKATSPETLYYLIGTTLLVLPDDVTTSIHNSTSLMNKDDLTLLFNSAGSPPRSIPETLRFYLWIPTILPVIVCLVSFPVILRGWVGNVFLKNPYISTDVTKITVNLAKLLSLSLSALLAGVLCMLSVQEVEAVPLTQRAPRFVTLPLKRVEIAGRDVHGQIYLQQHMNRAIRRLARMTRREEPSAGDLYARLEKRIVSIEGLEEGSLEKRYNRIGVPESAQISSGSKSTTASKAASLAEAHEGITNTQAQANNKGKGKGKGGAGGAGGQKAPAPQPSAQPGVVASDVTDAGQPTADDSLGLDIEAQDVGYLATVQLGTPPRDFLILMDSGSADFWVGAENCQSEGGGDCGNHNFLGPQSSSSFVDTNAPFSVTYGTGDVSGDIITDDVSIAGLALNAHKFGVATSESVDFSSDQTPFDGLMGLAQSTLSEQQTLTPVESLAAANLIPDSITSYKISRLLDNKNDGEITFGALDPTKFDAQTLISVPNVNTQGFWEADLQAITVNGQDSGLSGRTAILDTGTTLIVAPAADAQAVHDLINGAQSDGQGGFTVPCTLTDSVALQFGGQTFAIDPRDIAFTPVDPNDPTGDCVSGITSGDIGGPEEWLVGDVFLKNAYFSTDVSKNTVSLAKLIQQQHTNRALKRFALMSGRLPPSEYELLAMIYERILLLSTPRQRRYEIAKIAKILEEFYGCAEHKPAGRSDTSTDFAKLDTPRTYGRRAEYLASTNSTSGPSIHNIGLNMVVIKMGSPARNFNVLVDSGSADLWVGAEGCRGDDGGSCVSPFTLIGLRSSLIGVDCQGNHTLLGAHSSTTFNASQDDWAIGYDDVSIGGLKLKAHKFGVAMNESSQFTPDNIPFDGLLGLGKEMISQQRVPTLLQSLYKANLIPGPIVSYKLPRLADGYNDGEMTLGGMNPKRYNHKTLVTKKNVNEFGFWGVAVDGIQVGAQDMNWFNRTVVLDTGTTLIIAPQNDVNVIHSHILGARYDGSGWIVPCNMTTAIALTIGGQIFSIDPRDVAFYPVEYGSTECMSGIAVGGVGPFYLDNEWLVGDVFLKNVYFSTDDNKDTISIAKPLP